MKRCKIIGCDNKHNAKGLCNKHYQRYFKHGDPHTVLVGGTEAGVSYWTDERRLGYSLGFNPDGSRQVPARFGASGNYRLTPLLTEEAIDWLQTEIKERGE